MITIIVGAQYGSEGKGKVAATLCPNYDCAIRSGSVNSGHTIWVAGKRHVLRQLPAAAAVSSTCHMILPVGAVIDPPVLLREISEYGITSSRLTVDPVATIISANDRRQEAAGAMNEHIGSVTTGCGYAHSRRVNRRQMLTARDVPQLQPFLGATLGLPQLYQHTLIEGTQGFGLSYYHSPYYPYVTSRDTTAAGLCSEVGISPFDVTEIILVARLFPIRVAGNSGPLPNETTWSALDLEPEITSVTQRARRVACWDPVIVNTAIAVNRPTQLVLNHIDYAKEELNEAELDLTMPISWLGDSPSTLTRVR